MRFPFQKTFAQKTFTRENAALAANVTIILTAAVPLALTAWDLLKGVATSASTTAASVAAKFNNRTGPKMVDVG